MIEEGACARAARDDSARRPRHIGPYRSSARIRETRAYRGDDHGCERDAGCGRGEDPERARARGTNDLVLDRGTNDADDDGSDARRTRGGN